MKYKDLIRAIQKIAPPELAPNWDNSGVQIYSGENQIKLVLVCLEITDEIMVEAINKGVDLIVSHHPLIFNGLKSIDTDNISAEALVSKKILSLIRHNISVYSAHISFDLASKGNNWYLAQLLNLKDCYVPDEEAEIFPTIGFLSRPVALGDLLDLLAIKLSIRREEMRTVRGNNQEVSKIALCTGAGGDLIFVAARENCQCLITGDVKFHQAQQADGLGMNLIDAGHFATEKIFEGNFASQLKKLCGNELEIITPECQGNPFTRYI